MKSEPKMIDISPLVSPRTAVFPGDTPFSREYLLKIDDGANIDLSTIRSTVHIGAHCDSPGHYLSGGTGIASRDLSFYYGKCQIISVQVTPGARIFPKDFSVQIHAPRILFHTGSYPDPEHFNDDFNSLSPELIHYLADRGVRLVGLDTPSVDPADSKNLESHQAIADRDMAILEGVVLEDVSPGVYTLIALPLKIEGADASPVRAVLISE